MVDYPENKAATDATTASRLNAEQTTGPAQWLRKVSIQAQAPTGEALDFGDLHCTFHIRQNDTQSPNICELRVYNVAPDTIARVQKEFIRLVVQAGYQDSFGLIFDGTIRQVRHGRLDGADTYMEIAASDSDSAYNYAVVNQTLAAGSSTSDIIFALAKVLLPFGVTLASLPANFPVVTFPRGVVLWGMVRDRCREVARILGCNWSLANGYLTFYLNGSYVVGETIVLSAYTGVIGIPERTLDGICVRCLLNPNIHVGRQIEMKNKEINVARYNLTYQGEVQNFNLDQNMVAKDGYYKVVAVDYAGDTRGNAWFCDLILVDIDGTISIAQATRGRYLDASPGGVLPQ